MSSESGDENVFGGPVTAQELQLRWRFALERKPKMINERMYDNGQENTDPTEIPLPDDSFVSLESSSANTSRTSDNSHSAGPLVENNENLKLMKFEEQESSTLHSDPEIPTAEDKAMPIFNLDKEIYRAQLRNKENIYPSNKTVLFKSHIPVMDEKKKNLIKSPKFKFDKATTSSNGPWEFKMKKVPIKRPDYMISPGKVELYFKSKSTLVPNKLVHLPETSRSMETVHVAADKFRTPSKASKMYAYVQSPVGRYIRNEAIVKDNNKILPKF